MSAEIPERIRAIELGDTTISMKPYSRDGVLFPDIERVEKYKAKCLDIYANTPADSASSPVIVVMDFHGIEVLNYESARKSFVFPLEYFRGRRKIRLRELYSTYINLSTKSIRHASFASPWQSLQYILEDDHVTKPVVVARHEGPIYSLIGNPRKVAEREQSWRKLLEEGGWVNGHEFIRELPLPQMEFLNRLYKDGLALRAVHNGIPYFRSIV